MEPNKDSGASATEDKPSAADVLDKIDADVEDGDVTQKKRGRPKDPKNEPKKKKLKADPKPKAKKQVKVNVDKQCGVPLLDESGEPTGLLCARSLTCKTHPMGAKRAVRGRSMPYNALLTAYQQKNNLKSAANAALAAQKRLATVNAQQEMQDEEEAQEDGQPPLTDQEEIAAVINGAMHSTPIPLARSMMVATRFRNQQINLRELLFKSAASSPAPPLIGAPPLAAVMASTEAVQGRCVLFNPITKAHSVRPSQIYATTRMMKIMQDRIRERNRLAVQYAAQQQQHANSGPSSSSVPNSVQSSSANGAQP